MNTNNKYDILEQYDYLDLSSGRNFADGVNYFSNKKNSVKGLALMNHKKNLSYYAQELVADYAQYKANQYELSLDSLSDADQNELARLYIETIDREIEWACYGDDESINSEFLCALLSMLKDDNHKSRENFAAVTRKNILIYYKESLQAILDEACEDFASNENEQNHYRDSYDEQDCYDEAM